MLDRHELIFDKQLLHKFITRQFVLQYSYYLKNDTFSISKYQLEQTLTWYKNIFWINELFPSSTC